MALPLVLGNALLADDDCTQVTEYNEHVHASRNPPKTVPSNVLVILVLSQLANNLTSTVTLPPPSIEGQT